MPNRSLSRRSRRLLLGTTALVGAAMLPQGVMATDFWTGSVSSDWYTAGNWTSGLPDSSTVVSIGTVSPNPTVIDGGTANTLNLYMSNDPTLTSNLTLQNSAKLYSAGFGDIGVLSGANATMTVTGASSWQAATGVTVGDDATGTLTISGASTVSDLNTILGNAAGSSGTVTVTGTGSSLSSGLATTVGHFGSGSLTIANGATVTDVSGIVGELISGTGDVTIDGPGSTWSNAGGMRIGDFGVGTVTVQNGGTLHNGPAESDIGNSSSGQGTVTVTGAGSTMTDDETLVVGNQGHGTLNILAGGVVNDAASNIAFNPQSVGDATVDGTGSQWNIANKLTVGNAGTGSLTISNGGLVSDLDASIGNVVDGVGTVTVTGAGSTWTTTHALDVGYAATGSGSTKGGTLNVSSGGSVGVKDLNIGTTTGSTGAVTVDGAGSALTASNDLNVGYHGTGTLSVKNGSSVTDKFGSIGALVGGSGTAVVDGAGSTWTNTGSLVVGTSGDGVLDITNGARVLSTDGAVGNGAGATGTATIDGVGSTWDMTGGGLEVGYLGTGTLSILDGGTALASTTEIGAKTGSLGTMVIDGAGSALNNSFTTYVGTDGTGKLTLSDGGTLASTFVEVGYGTGSGKIVIGGDVAAAPGIITAFGGSGAHYVNLDNSGELDFNHTSSNYVFDAMLGGNGTIKQKAGTTVLTGNSGSSGGNFTGTAFVDGGKLVVDGDLSGGAVIVDAGGTLGGTGIVDNLTANTGGIVAPGNSIGTLQVAADAHFEAGSFYDVEVNRSGASDLIAAGGVATIAGGTVEVQAAPGQYGASTQYTILTTTGVTGQYAAATVDTPFLTASLSEDGSNVYLTLTRTNPNLFQNAGQTPNEQATGAGLDSAAVGNAAANALFALGSSAQASALDQLSGEIHASLKGVVLDDSRYVREAVNDRLRRPLGGDGAGSGLWESAFGSFGQANGDGNAGELDSKTGGLFVGADGTVTNGLRLGVLGGYSRGTYDVSSRNSTASTDSLNAAIYGGFETGGFGLRLGADYAVHAIHTDRSVSFTGFSDQTEADYASQTGQAFGELGYKMQVGSASFEPFAAAAYVRQSTGGFTEAGGSSALTGQADVVAATFTTLGVRVASDFDLGATKGTLRGSLGWRHAFGDLASTSTMSFANGDAFTVAGVPLAADAAVLEAGIDLAVAKDVTFGASYSGQISASGFDNGAKANLNWQF